jgi:hypothetical protein
MVVGNDRDQSPDDRQADLLSHQGRGPGIGGIHRHGRIAEHRFGSRGRDGDVCDRHPPRLHRLGQRVFQIPEVAVDQFVLDLVVGQNRLRGRVPVDQPLAAKDQAVAEEVEEVGPNRFGAGLVHREPRPRPVARATHRFELGKDAGLVLILPRLDMADKLRAGKFRPPLALLLEEPLFDDRLRGDPGVVGAGHPEGIETAHPVVTDEDILQRVVERMTQMQRRGNIGRRDHDRVGPLDTTGRGIGVEIAALIPDLLSGGLHRPGFVQFREFVHR